VSPAGAGHATEGAGGQPAASRHAYPGLRLSSVRGLTKRCRRRPTASARASLPLSGAPERQRWAAARGTLSLALGVVFIQMNAGQNSLQPTLRFPVDHPIWEKHAPPVFLELRGADGPVPALLQERDGEKVFVRRPNPGEEGGRIEIHPGDEVYLITPIAGMFITTSPTVGDRRGDLYWASVQEIRREGHQVFVEPVRPGEPRPKRPVYLGDGDQLIFPQGAISVSFADIDRTYGAEPDKYHPISSSLWAWLAFSERWRDDRGAVYLLTVAQKLDLANELAQSLLAIMRDPEAPDMPAHQVRALAFEIVAKSHTTIILLHRAYRMLCEAPRRLRVRPPSPKHLRPTQDVLRMIRDAIEHSEEHTLADSSETPYDWGRIFREGVLAVDGASFNIIEDTKTALLEARRYLVQLADAPAIGDDC
jgi:hypothetical protein